MSTYTDYSAVSANYDRTRGHAPGLDPVLEYLAAGGIDPATARFLDAGCGTGTYAAALSDRGVRVTGLELNPGMLARAREKNRDRSDVELIAGDITAMPFDEAAFDAVVNNQVIHHLPLATDGAFDGLAAFLKEARRVLRPGGFLMIHTCSYEQMRDGFWWADLIPDAMQAMCRRMPDIPELAGMLDDAGFEATRPVVPRDVVLQNVRYLDGRGPLDPEWRDGDSAWSLAGESELETALTRVREMDAAGELNAYLQKREALRRKIGQITLVFARRPAA